MTQFQLIQHLKRQPRLGAGPLDDFKEAAEKVFASLTSGLAALTNENTTLLVGLERQLGVNEALKKEQYKRIEGATLLEKRNAALNKSLGITSEQAGKISSEIANFSKNLKIGSSTLRGIQGTFKKLATTVDLTASGNRAVRKELATSQTLLTRNLQLSEQQAENFQYYSSQLSKDQMKQGVSAMSRLKTTIKIADAIERETGMSGALKTITEEISAASAATQLQFGRMPGTLEMAAIKAKSLGFSLDDMASSGKQMLDIESSIGNELEYQLLSGRRLTDDSGKSLTNAYREATIKGDMNAQADIMNKILEDEGETLENNLFAREQMSKLLGIDEVKLSRALQKKKILEQVGDAGKELMGLKGDALIKKAQALIKAGTMDDAQLNDIIKLERDTRTTDERVDELIEINEDALGFNIFQADQTTKIKDGQELILKAIQQPGIDLGTAEQRALGQVSLAEGTMGALAQVKDILTARKDFKTQKAATGTGDLLYVPGMGTATGGYGDLFNLDPRDAVMAGPPDAIKSAAQGAGMDPMIFVKAIVEGMKGVNLEVTVDPVAAGFA